MAMNKRHAEILERLDAIEAHLAGSKTATAPKTNKKELREKLIAIKGVGEALADEILKVVDGK